MPDDANFDVQFQALITAEAKAELPPPPISMLPSVEQNLRADVGDLIKLSTALEQFVERVLGDTPHPGVLALPELSGSTLSRISDLQDIMRGAILRLEQAVARASAIG